MVPTSLSYRNSRVRRIAKEVLAVPVGPTHQEARRLTRKYVREMSPDAVQKVLDRQREIEDKADEEYLLRREVLGELGFTPGEQNIFGRCRLNSPGIRTIIRERVEVTQHATPEEIVLISTGRGSGTLKGLYSLFGDGGLYGRRKKGS